MITSLKPPRFLGIVAHLV